MLVATGRNNKLYSPFATVCGYLWKYFDKIWILNAIRQTRHQTSVFSLRLERCLLPLFAFNALANKSESCVQVWTFHTLPSDPRLFWYSKMIFRDFVLILIFLATTSAQTLVPEEFFFEYRFFANTAGEVNSTDAPLATMLSSLKDHLNDYIVSIEDVNIVIDSIDYFTRGK